MSARDIMPWNSAHGGTYRTTRGFMQASETFFVGEPVTIDAGGEIAQCATEPTQGSVFGIAAIGPGSDGNITNPRTGTTTWSEGESIPVWVPEPGMQWITSNYTQGTAFDDVPPTIAVIGDAAGLALIGGVWGIDQTPTANDATCRIIDILDDMKNTIVRPGAADIALAVGDTYYVVFEIVSHMGTPDSGEATAPA